MVPFEGDEEVAKSVRATGGDGGSNPADEELTSGTATAGFAGFCGGRERRDFETPVLVPDFFFLAAAGWKTAFAPSDLVVGFAAFFATGCVARRSAFFRALSRFRASLAAFFACLKALRTRLYSSFADSAWWRAAAARWRAAATFAVISVTLGRVVVDGLLDRRVFMGMAEGAAPPPTPK